MLQVLESQVQVQVLKTNYQVQPKYRYRYVINKESNSTLNQNVTIDSLKFYTQACYLSKVK